MENRLEANKVEAPDREEATAVVHATMKFILVTSPHSSLALERTQHLHNLERPGCFHAQGRAFKSKLS